MFREIYAIKIAIFSKILIKKKKLFNFKRNQNSNFDI